MSSLKNVSLDFNVMTKEDNKCSKCGSILDGAIYRRCSATNVGHLRQIVDTLKDVPDDRGLLMESKL